MIIRLSQTVLFSAATIISLGACSQTKKFKKYEQPNVIYIFPDQFRNQALGFWRENGFRDKINYTPDPVITPNLNKFAKESVVLTSAMSNCPLSSPHRGMLLTGMYPNKSGVPLNCNADRPISNLRSDVECISDVFSHNGYDCAYIGKLHVDHPTPNNPQNPGTYVEDKIPAWDAYTPPSRRHGFNYWYSYGTYDVHKTPHYWDTAGKRHEIKEWSPQHEADKAIEYLKNTHHVRDPKKPFFMMIGMNPPHSPYRSIDDCMPEDYDLYKDTPVKKLLVRDNANPQMEKAANVPFYFASVSGVDREFGRILQTLKDLGLDKNTIVIFASDHGETMCSQNTDDPKNSPYSEAMNIPFIVRYPDKLKPRVESDLLLSSPDIMPTVLGLAGLGNKVPKNVQGTDFSSLFLDENSMIKRPEGILYIQNLDGDKDKTGNVISYFPSARGIKTQEYTLAIFINREKKINKILFFNDLKDPYQMSNLPVEANGKIFKELCNKMGKLLKDIDDPWYQEKILNDIIQY
ncbi:sulfatase family protein [Coprobacter tertius]|uniref:Sulfatase n=1 Tax=Coprobacter tertius TaxID=2944915 RepID=A0ABT1MJI2_9BACT|nr:sulfatase [Coprobacter tertius]MCP9612524.1 sulfatase [Coprobacter tertius]